MNYVLNNFRTRATLLLAVSLLFLSPCFALAAESINYYEVNITPDPDGTFQVVETIQYDFGPADRHGIFREIPIKHPQPASSKFKKRYIDISSMTVSMDGSIAPSSQSISSDLLSLRIGDPDTTISGMHTYTITYSVSGGLQYFDDGTTELYWDAIGTGWTVPIKEAVVIINNKNDLLTGKYSCYVGNEGSQTNCPEAKLIEGDYYNTINGLAAGEGITVAYELNAEKVSVLILERYVTWYLWPLLALLSVLALGTWLYRYKTEFKTGNPIIAQYEPYEDVKPMYTGLLLDGRLDPKDITAGIVYLAEQGYIKIKKTSAKVLFFFEVDDYEVTLVKLPDDALSPFQRDVLTLLFSTTIVGQSITLSSLKTNHSKQRTNQKILRNLRKDLEKDLVEKGFYQTHLPTSVRNISISVGVGILLAIAFSPVVVIIMVFAFIMLFVLSKRRTRKGYEALDHLKGFKDFLGTTEKERYKFHNAPAKSPEQFMEYLPYAIAFGAEKEWANVFKDITIPDPDWYDGGGAGSFSAVNLTTSIGAFSTAFASSSGSSGAGGGGSVGGGGGGGGGGSW